MTDDQYRACLPLFVGGLPTVDLRKPTEAGITHERELYVAGSIDLDVFESYVEQAFEAARAADEAALA
jgi:hypothetical protein